MVGERRRVLVIGLDAAEPRLVREWAAAGELPAIAALLAGGAARVENAPGLYEGAVWPSFATGRGPAGHGRTCFRQFDPSTYRDRDVSPRQVDGTPFWLTAARAGRNVIVLDVPKSAPADHPGLLQLCDWGTHDHDFPRPQGSPSGLVREVVRRFGRDPVGSCDVPRRRLAAYAELADRLVLRARRRGEIAAWLLGHGEWDLATVVFTESHCAGHQLWHLHTGDDGRGAPTADPLRRVYRALDAEVGRLVALAGDEVDVVLLASHGMGPHRSGNHLLEPVLRHLDGDPAAATGDRGLYSLRRAWQRLPGPLASVLDPLRRAVRTPIESALLAPGRRPRRFFAVPNNDACGGVRLNLHGREAAGLVDAGEAPELLDRLRVELKGLVRDDDGSPAVEEVIVTATSYQGPFAAVLPDLLVLWDRSREITTLRLGDGIVVRGRYSGFRSGDHLSDGLLAGRPGAGSTLNLPASLAMQAVAGFLLGRLGNA